jgi:hypothetical protein
MRAINCLLFALFAVLSVPASARADAGPVVPVVDLTRIESGKQIAAGVCLTLAVVLFGFLGLRNGKAAFAFFLQLLAVGAVVWLVWIGWVILLFMGPLGLLGLTVLVLGIGWAGVKSVRLMRQSQAGWQNVAAMSVVFGLLVAAIACSTNALYYPPRYRPEPPSSHPSDLPPGETR